MPPCSAILTYHSLDESGSVISLPPALFARQMERIAAARIPVLPLAEAVRRPGSLAITFDDGFVNFHEHALPVLARHGFPATVFVVTGHCGLSNDWPGQPSSIPRLPLMDWFMLAGLPARGIAVGAHSITHPRLTGLGAGEAEAEICGSAAEIRDRLGIRAAAFAYPYGESSPAIRELARKHFDIACGIRLAYVRSGADLTDAPRIDAYYLRGWLQPHHLFRPTGRLGIRFRSLLREARPFRAAPMDRRRAP